MSTPKQRATRVRTSKGNRSFTTSQTKKGLFLTGGCLSMVLFFFLVSGGLLFAIYISPLLIFSSLDKVDQNYVAPSGGMGLCQVVSDAKTEQLDTGGVSYFWPVPSVHRISSPFGLRNSPVAGGSSNHKGIDISLAGGGAALHPFYAMADGVVTFAGPATGYGYVIYVQHANGIVTKYGHIDSDFEVHRGDAVKKGQRLGRIGSGIVGASTGPHLHFQVEQNGVPVDPLNFVSSDGTTKPGNPFSGSAPSICDNPLINAGRVDISIAYQPLNIQAMHDYLAARNGVGTRMADMGILTMVDRVGKEYNLDPYLLLAITGAEQSFVPNNNPNADRIIRNPWNTFGSWQNTDHSTEESARYAAKAIVKLQQDKPEGMSPLQWMNQPRGVNPRGFYAEDSRWATNVGVILDMLHTKGGAQSR